MMNNNRLVVELVVLLPLLLAAADVAAAPGRLHTWDGISTFTNQNIRQHNFLIKFLKS